MVGSLELVGNYSRSGNKFLARENLPVVAVGHLMVEVMRFYLVD